MDNDVIGAAAVGAIVTLVLVGLAYGFRKLKQKSAPHWDDRSDVSGD